MPPRTLQFINFDAPTPNSMLYPCLYSNMFNLPLYPCPRHDTPSCHHVFCRKETYASMVETCWMLIFVMVSCPGPSYPLHFSFYTFLAGRIRVFLFLIFFLPLHFVIVFLYLFIYVLFLVLFFLFFAFSSTSSLWPDSFSIFSSFLPHLRFVCRSLQIHTTNSPGKKETVVKWYKRNAAAHISAGVISPTIVQQCSNNWFGNIQLLENCIDRHFAARGVN